MKKSVRSAAERAIRWSATIGMLVLVPLMLITTGDVLARSFWNKPIAGTFELSECMLAVLILLGTGYTQQEKGHVTVVFLTNKFSLNARLTCRVLTTALSLSIVGILAWQGFSLAIEETAVTDQLRVPRAPFKMLVGIGAGLLWLQLLLDLLDAAAALLRRPR